MGTAALSKFLFRNNGQRDELTHAPAPSIFLEKLRSEFFRGRRDSANLSILSIRERSGELISEGRLIALAREIESQLRGDEFFTRISETGFWIAVRGDRAAAEFLAVRILDSEIKKWRTSIIECTPSLTFDEWITSADLVHFSDE